MPARTALTPDEEREVIRLIEGGSSQMEVANQFGVHRNTVRNIMARHDASAMKQESPRPSTTEA